MSATFFPPLVSFYRRALGCFSCFTGLIFTLLHPDWQCLSNRIPAIKGKKKKAEEKEWVKPVILSRI